MCRSSHRYNPHCSRLREGLTGISSGSETDSEGLIHSSSFIPRPGYNPGANLLIHIHAVTYYYAILEIQDATFQIFLLRTSGYSKHKNPLERVYINNGYLIDINYGQTRLVYLPNTDKTLQECETALRITRSTKINKCQQWS